MNNSSNFLILESKARGQFIVQQELGHLRSLAAHVKHNNEQIDEEEFFRRAAAALLSGMKHEIGKIFGPENANDLLSLWPVKKN